MKMMCTKLAESGSDFQEEANRVNQLTINEYYPGQGISSHVGQNSPFSSTPYSLSFEDAESCFGPFILILSLGSDIVMTLTELDSESPLLNQQPQQDRGETIDVVMDETKSEASVARRNFGPTKPQPGGEQRKKHVYLPSRSLLVLTGPSRYQWAHHIAMRKMDKVNSLYSLLSHSLFRSMVPFKSDLEG